MGLLGAAAVGAAGIGTMTGRSKASNHDTMGTISIIGTGTKTEYRIAVSGGLEKSEALGASINSNDEVSADGTQAKGYVGGGTDSYVFSGEITTLDLSNDGANVVVLNGGSGSSNSETSRTVAPGDMQSAIDDAATDRGFETVVLDPAADYPISDTIHVGEGVRLEANGATIGVEADVDALAVHPSAQVADPHVVYASDEVSSDALVFDDDLSDYGWHDHGHTLVRGGFIEGGKHGAGRDVSGSAIKFDANTDGMSGILIDGIVATGFGEIWEIDSGQSNSGTWVNSNRVNGSFSRVNQAVHFHGENRMTDNMLTGWYQNGWMADRFLTLEGDARANWFQGTWWDLRGANEVEDGGSAFHFGPDTDRNVSISRVPYRDWPDSLPINDRSGTNEVIDQHSFREALSEYAP